MMIEMEDDGFGTNGSIEGDCAIRDTDRDTTMAGPKHCSIWHNFYCVNHRVFGIVRNGLYQTQGEKGGE